MCIYSIEIVVNILTVSKKKSNLLTIFFLSDSEVYIIVLTKTQMKNILLFISLSLLISCSSKNNADENSKQANADGSIQKLFSSYYEHRLHLFPLDATSNGDHRFDDQLPNNITESFRDTLKQFYSATLDSLNLFDRNFLTENNQASFDILQWDLKMNIEALNFPDHLMPINQFWSLSITMGQLGAGSGIQPFETVKDYENFLMRAHSFVPWCDTAIANMKRGIAQSVTLPQVLAKKYYHNCKA